jgi:hypothetical protein
MESAGYEMPEEQAAEEQPLEEEASHVDVYAFGDHRFALSEEVVTAEDGLNYVKLEELDGNFNVQLDENGSEILVEFVEFDDVDYILEGVYEDEEGNLFACMLSESDFEEEELDEKYDAKEAKKAEMKEKMMKGMKKKSKKSAPEMEDEEDEKEEK